MYRQNTLLALLALFLVASASIAEARNPDDPYFIDQMRKHEIAMSEAKAVLESKDQDEWTDAELENYLFNAMFYIYQGVNVYISRNYVHPIDQGVFESSGIITNWPGNPFQNWAPIQWSADDSSFSAGNIYMQICPTSEYSLAYGSSDIEVPKTFMMTIFGDSEDYTPLNIPNNMFSWSSVPQGTVSSAGSSWSNAETMREKRDAAIALKESLEAKQSGNEKK